MLREHLLEESTDLLPMLTMAIGHGEKVTILLATEVGYRDPHILILFVRITGGNACFCGECKLSNAIGIHLLWIA